MSPGGISMDMDLHPILDDMLDDFINCEMERVIHQGAELELAMKRHQARMKDVCHSIKAHDHWVKYGEHFPFTVHCKHCGDAISPEFDWRRHRGLCELRAWKTMDDFYDS